jgi:TetR/AcrR family acrAB operon transcriptional repressor
MERGFRTARADGRLRAGTTPRGAAIGLHALVEGLLSSWMLAPAQFKLARVADDAVRTYLNGLSGSAAITHRPRRGAQRQRR